MDKKHCTRPPGIHKPNGIIDEYYKGELKDGLPNYKVNIYENYKEEITKNPEIREDIKEKLYETIINFSKILGIKSKTAK